jgi:cell wall-associated NlpC family hydrolase
MALRSRLITGIVIACSLVLANCAFPVRPGYDRKSGSYKRYRVPKQETVEIDSTTVNQQEELVQEERLAATSKNNGEVQANKQDSTGKSVLTSSDTAKAATSVTAQAAEKNVANTSAKSVEKQAEKKTEKAVAKKTAPTQKQTKRTAKPTNLEKYAKEWLGAKYVYGAAGKKKTDCSGYVMQVYKGFYGIPLDHSAQHIYDDGRGYSIRRSKLQEGDLVFFGNFWKISHVGIYLKGNRFIHASTSKGVVITSMDDNYWSSKYKGARRFK